MSMLIELTWTELKSKISAKKQIKYVEQETFYSVIYGDFCCKVGKNGTTEQTEFEADYKPLANTPSFPEVYTRPKNEMVLKLACASGATDVNGYVEITIKVPGTFTGGNGQNPPYDDGRFIESGLAWFNSGSIGDKVLSVHAVDVDRILAALYGGLTDEQMQAASPFPDYPVIGGYTDDEQESANNRGWFLHPTEPMRIDAADGPAFIPSGMYLRVRAQKVAGFGGTDTLYCNFKWSKVE